tara:strand:+ start:2743 stop:3456 length:714 start_codon:yes stop_codon:yes gene_type:complete
MVLGIIPARLNSSRFPKKILADIGGRPMISYVVDQALKSKKLDRVVVAVDNVETIGLLERYNYDIKMTSKKHQSGTDRVNEVAELIPDAKIIINIQGDEPMLNPKLIDNLVDLFYDDRVEMATIVSKKISSKDILDLNVVKAIIDEYQYATSFKRSSEEADNSGLYKHIGIYGFRRKTLFRFSNLDPSINELKYSLEQLRALDNGIKIKTLICNEESFSVDTKMDLENVIIKMGFNA